ncbi:MAG: cold shock domain-containing protein [Holosporales bacterium]|jgi:CspA family cold shock protein|nr:cold shock domain-containing protein [Holosporales bacterium]
MSDNFKTDTFAQDAKFENEEVILRWFCPYRGYGFVVHPKIPEDIFVHFSVVNKSGCENLEPGDRLLCDISQKGNKYQITEIYKVDHIAKVREPEVLDGIVKWYNPIKGFGFVWSEEKKDDIFVHSSVLKRLGLQNLTPEQKVIMRVQKTRNGLEALDLMLGS